MRVAVGMSGGVDSSVAAVLLQEQGYDVVGISMSIWDEAEKCGGGEKHSCYGPDEKEDIAEAEKTCDSLGMPFYVFDCSKEYKNIVIEYFKYEYLSARTPNPCIVCNHKIKFDALLRMAGSSGIRFDKFATGHYAKVEYDARAGRHLLKKARDKRKDQSYFLYRLSQEQLSGVIFPLGDLTKEAVREKARAKGIAVCDKEESQDFYSGDYRELLNINEAEGDIALSSGRVIGKHKGFWNYTPGQRKGLGIAFSEPLYVIRLDGKTNTVIVGTKDEMNVSSFLVNDLNWIAEKPREAFSAMTKIRSSQNEFESVVEILDNNKARVALKDANEPVSPGQSAVFYNGDTVIAGGIIEELQP